MVVGMVVGGLGVAGGAEGFGLGFVVGFHYAVTLRVAGIAHKKKVWSNAK
jgi:hypothetical protein